MPALISGSGPKTTLRMQSLGALRMDAIEMLKRVMLAAAMAATADSALAQAPDTRPSPLEPELSDVAVLPDPTPHRVLLLDAFAGGEARLLDGDTGKLLGGVSAASLSNIGVGPGARQIFVAESIWTKGNRGDRQDMVSVYDGKTLNLAAEIPIPGRVFMGSRSQNFVVTPSGQRGYVYNMDPSSSVIVVDLAARKVAQTIEAPGCALIFAFGEGGFSSLCGDGALATVTLASTGPALTRTKPFFDAERDPVFENSPTDPASGRTIFVTYTGLVHTVRLGQTPTFEKPWSMQAAGGFAPPAPDRELAWRPGGNQPLTLHRASNRLFVLMHAGGHWTHKEAGQEVWILDVDKQSLIKRYKLENPVTNILVTQDADPLLFGVDRAGTLYTLKPDSGEVVKTIKGVGGLLYDPAA